MYLFIKWKIIRPLYKKFISQHFLLFYLQAELNLPNL